MAMGCAFLQNPRTLGRSNCRREDRGQRRAREAIEAGKFADVVAVPGDVLRDIRATERPVFVMKQGAVVRAP